MVPLRYPALVCLAPCLIAATGCDSSAPARVWPEGTVLAIDGEPILQSEVDEWVETVQLLERSETLPSLRRKALVNIVLPRKIASLLDPERRRNALAEAQRVRATLEGRGEPDGAVEVRRVEGSCFEVGMDVWGMARHLPIGEWSPVLETVGGFYVFRVIAKPDEPWPPSAVVAVDQILIPYLDPEAPRELVDQAYDQVQLAVIDPAWREIVPAHYLYRMAPDEKPR